MILKTGITFLLIFISHFALGQSASAERAILKSIKKKHWSKARQQLAKASSKDSANAVVRFLFSKYFFQPDNPQFNIDSANYFAKQTGSVLRLSNDKERQRLARSGIDSTGVVRFQQQIDSAAFHRSKMLNTEGAYLHFLSEYPGSDHLEEAVYLRDEAAYANALAENTFQSLLRFLEKYPKAERAPEARSRYERLLYDTKTRDHTLSSYQGFLRDYPASPFRRDAEKNVMEIATAGGDIQSFIQYLVENPYSSSAQKAKNILFHLAHETSDSLAEQISLTDSLVRVRRLNEGYWVPVLKNNLFGFLSSDGKIALNPSAATIAEEYLCGNITDDVLVVDNHLTARNGARLIEDSVSAVSDISYGFLLVETGNCLVVIHKSGYQVGDCVEDAKILNGKFLAIRKNNKWSLYTFAGRNLSGFEWDEITNLKDIVIFKRDNKYYLMTSSNAWRAAEAGKFVGGEAFDAVRPWTSDGLLAEASGFRGVFDQQLNVIIPFDRYELKPTFFGTSAEVGSVYKLHLGNGDLIGSFDEVSISQPWLAVKSGNAWQLLDPYMKHTLSVGFDSLVFDGIFARGYFKDSVKIHFNKHIVQHFPATIKTTFIAGRDSSAFVVIELNKKKVLFDAAGHKLFTAEFDQIQHAGNGYFIVTRKEKKGLVNIKGQLVLQAEYDAIGSITDEVITLLKNSRFGAYHVYRKKLIRPQYEKNVVSYNDDLIGVFQKGNYGFVNWDNKPQSTFDYSEILYWNDSIALLRKNTNWSLYDLDRKKLIGQAFSKLTYVSESDDEKVCIVKQDTGYGVLSSKSGFVIPTAFAQVVNVGSADHPLYFTAKHVEEAMIVVVIYYDRSGKLLLRQVFEEDEFDKIHCSDN